jgi:xylulokinase
VERLGRVSALQRAGREKCIVSDYVLTIDLGTSGPKTAVFTLDGEFIDGEFEPVELLLGAHGAAGQRPADWWAGVVAGVRRMAARGALPAEGFAAISVTSQWSGTVAIDAKGEPVADAVIWMDSRGADDIARIVGGPLRVQGYDARKLRKWISLTGGVPSLSGKDPIAHIHWLRRTRPELSADTAMYLEPKDWLNLRLTGVRAATFDSIVMSWVTDNRDPDAVRYSDELLALAGLRREWMPDLLPATSIVGFLTDAAAAELGIAAGVPVIGGTPDVQSAAVGSGAVRDHEGHLYLGTSSWLSCHVPYKKTDVLRGVASLPSPLPGRYFVANEQETAGACMNWLRDNVLFPDDPLGTQVAPDDVLARIDALAATAPPGSRGAIFTPWLNGERTPVDDHTIRGGWHHLSLRTDRADLVRSVLEGVAFNSRWLLDAVERFTGRPFPWLNVVGGGGNSAIWAQIHADVMDRPIRRVAHPIRANARGAALLAGVALGRVDADDLGAKVEVIEVHEPDPANRASYDELYRAFRSIYKQNRSIHRRLDRRHG